MSEREFLAEMDSYVRLSDLTIATNSQVYVEKEWNGSLLKTEVTNISRIPLRVKEIVLFSGDLPVLPSTKFYGEGYQMLY